MLICKLFYGIYSANLEFLLNLCQLDFFKMLVLDKTFATILSAWWFILNLLSRTSKICCITFLKICTFYFLELNIFTFFTYLKLSISMIKTGNMIFRHLFSYVCWHSTLDLLQWSTHFILQLVDHIFVSVFGCCPNYHIVYIHRTMKFRVFNGINGLCLGENIYKDVKSIVLGIAFCSRLNIRWKLY